ncbi:MAG TPA: hypothetical protein VHD32_05150 [Candidatus Didemnitutus sp.]|nr:hypothetical protein [Candidatus Didemnitutus sp.]
MRTTLSVLAAAGLLGLTATAFAAAETPAKPAEKTAPAPAKPEKAEKTETKTVMLTGSNLPQKVTKVGRITDSAQPVTVITHDDLEKSGAISVSDALRKMVPAIH